MKRIFLSCLAAVSLAFNTFGVPAMPGKMAFVQPDGTTIEAYMHGDEYFHFYETAGGAIFLRDSDGVFRYASVAGDGSLTTTDIVVSPAAATEAAALKLQNPGKLRAAILRHYTEIKNCGVSDRQQLPASASAKKDFPTTGTVRGLVILAEYQDVKFLPKSTREYFETKINQEGYSGPETYGSVIDYFKAQSMGQFTPEFDVVGPVTLPHERAYYGLYELIGEQVRDACIEADTKFGTDFTRYDVNNDGFVDFVFVIYAGHGEAQGGPAESFWPAMKDLSSSVYDYFDGLCLSRAACSCELKGAEGEEWDGIGTICHEFSHILGLPDIYDATNTGGYGMGHYDIMDVGTYNGNSTTPSGYTAMDKYSLGWIEQCVLDKPGRDYVLEPFSTSSQAYFIVNPDNSNEFYSLENRRQTGWDSALPGQGLIISYINYDAALWTRNIVNAPSRSGYEHVQIVPADNSLKYSDENDDPYPGSGNNFSFTDSSQPAAVWKSGREKKPVEQPVTNISIQDDGTVKFDFKASSAIDRIDDDGAAVTGGNGLTANPDVEIYNLQGIRVGNETLSSGIYIVKSGSLTSKIVVR